MEDETCQVCGYKSELGVTEKHHVVPTEVTEPGGIPRSKIVRLCRNCHRELHRWYSTRVADMVYDPEAKRFRAKSSPEMVKEYESAYESFVRFKGRQKKRPQRS